MPNGRAGSPLQLGPVPEASSKARRYVRAALTALDAEALVDAAELGVSELVTNACLHARTEITVNVRVTRHDHVRIEVSDESPRRPEARQTDAMTTTGRGLRLLAGYGRWGVSEPRNGKPGKTVWFEPASDDALSPSGRRE